MADELSIIGVDAAAQPKNVGLSRARLLDRLVVDEVVPSCKGRDPARIVAEWLVGASRALIAIDAPLGWPRPLAAALVEHRAGDPLDAEPNSLFRRSTDRLIHERVGKMPLDVGADRIARAAHAALAFLGAVREQLGAALPLAWTPDFSGLAAIEVYPAATLRARSIQADGYKEDGAAGREARRLLLRRLRDDAVIPATADVDLEQSDDAIDAVVAALAGEDFVRGRSLAPAGAEELALARREGWIWVRRGSAPVRRVRR